MIWTQKEVSDFVDTVLPPGEKQCNHGYSEMVEFADALATAISEWPEGYINAPLILDALRKKWPEAVETSLPEAHRMLAETEKRSEERKTDQNLPDAGALDWGRRSARLAYA
jgi:hypothetical protein